MVFDDYGKTPYEFIYVFWVSLIFYRDHYLFFDYRLLGFLLTFSILLTFLLTFLVLLTVLLTFK